MAAKLQRNQIAERNTIAPVVPEPITSAPSTPPSPTSAAPVVGKIEQLTESDVRRIVDESLGSRGPLAKVLSTPLDKLKLVALALSSDELNEIRSVLNGTFISTPRELINAIRRMAVVSAVSSDDSAEFAKITLAEDVLTRIHTRMPPDTTHAEFLQERIEEWTQMYVDGSL